MLLDGITYVGPPFEEDSCAVSLLPDELVELLRQINGFVLFDGGLHVRGVCQSPDWHSLSSVWEGEGALHKLYPALRPSDVPFAQDCVADQYILRDHKVHKLYGDTGELLELHLTLPEFFAAVDASPVEFLAMEPLQLHQKNGGVLLPGHVLHVYPPFCTQQAEHGVSVKAVPYKEAMAFLSSFSQQMSSLSNGQAFHFKVIP